MIQVKDNSTKEINRSNEVLLERILNRYKISIDDMQKETYRTLKKCDNLLSLRILQLYILNNVGN